MLVARSDAIGLFMADWDEGGPLRRAMTSVIGRVVDFLIGGDVLAPDRDDFDDREIDFDEIGKEQRVADGIKKAATHDRPPLEIPESLTAIKRREASCDDREGSR